MTFRIARNDGGDVPALFAADDGSWESTRFSKLPILSDSSDAGWAHDVDSADFAASLRLGDIFRGDVGRLACMGDDERVGPFGGGIIPFVWSTFATGRDIAIFGCCDVGLGALRFPVLGLVLFGDASAINKQKNFKPTGKICISAMRMHCNYTIGQILSR